MFQSHYTLGKIKPTNQRKTNKQTQHKTQQQNKKIHPNIPIKQTSFEKKFLTKGSQWI